MRLLLLLVLLLAGPARAEVVIGAVLSLTGPSAGLGIPARNTIALLPPTLGGEAVRWVVLDDGSDPAGAVRAVRKLIEEERVDAIIGPSNAPASLAVLDAAAGTPFLSLAGSDAVIQPPEGARRWAFKLFPGERLATGQMAAHMKRSGTGPLAMIGFSTALGDGYFAAMRADAAAQGIPVVAEARYAPGDASVTPQVLRLLQAKPGAVFVAASAVPATTPIIELRARGFTGPIYTVMGIAGPDALRVGGRALDGVLLSGVPVLVAEALDDDNPVKPEALRFVDAYEAKYGPGSRNLTGATLWDSYLLLEPAVSLARLAHLPHGTPEYREYLRRMMEGVRNLPGAEAVFSLSSTDHSGALPASQVMIEIRGGGYRLVPP